MSWAVDRARRTAVDPLFSLVLYPIVAGGCLADAGPADAVGAVSMRDTLLTDRALRGAGLAAVHVGLVPVLNTIAADRLRAFVIEADKALAIGLLRALLPARAGN